MSDRELLELAAKAAGIRGMWDPYGSQFRRYFEGQSTFFGDAWNPLEDDGDALRLAIHVGIFDGPRSFAKFYPWLEDALVVIDDHAEAFKRAVTCYAAENGRAMP